MIEVVRAEAMGLCFGVRDALDVAFGREDAGEVTIYGELVHNESVLGELTQMGYQMLPESDRGGEIATEKVLITAHGISRREREELLSRGHQLIDTTCPLVQKVHNAALRLQDAGYFVVVIGRHGHVEVTGIVGDLDQYAIVESVADAGELRIENERVGLVCQTTFPADRAEAVAEALCFANPKVEFRFYNTTCEPTRQRQAALQRLCDRVDAVVVVGGKNSNNTAALKKACQARGVPAVQVQGPGDLDPAWIKSFRLVGLTAGTSTQEEDVDRIHRHLLTMASRRSSA